MSFTVEKLQKILHQQFGFQNFKRGQFEAIQILLQQGRLLCVQPTGHGKSLLYQLPSTLLPGITIVISPLLALMRDQVDHLNRRFRIPAASLNSDQTEAENFEIRRRLLAREIKILFVSPEQLSHIDRLPFFLNLPIDLIVVDEAHCISMWGHDFRPDYRQILEFILQIQRKNDCLRVLGLTATADQRTGADICQQLSKKDRPMIIHRESMDRPNIALSVIKIKNRTEKLAQCEKILTRLFSELNSKIPKTGLIYCATRENTEFVADYLKTAGLKAEYYHAGLPSDIKKQLQNNFISEKYPILVATNALGMGIDKQNLRFIIHYDMPGSMTSYYQEVGRCGRDGKLAFGILLYDPTDQKIQKNFIYSAFPCLDDFKNILDVLKERSLNLMAIKTLTGLHPTRISVILSELIEQKYLKKSSMNGTQVYQKTLKLGEPELSRYELQFKRKTDELLKMLNYGNQSTLCRMLFLRQALGDEVAVDEKCGHCDVCKKRMEEPLDNHKLDQITLWQNTRSKRIAETKKYHISSGFSLLERGSPLFIEFMKNRAIHETLSDQMINRFDEKIRNFCKNNQVIAVFVIPSRTWVARQSFSTELARRLKIPFLLESLYWSTLPNNRQGELLNNDQRRHNVHHKMSCQKTPIPTSGSILLLDDYIGSGATLQEAARAIRQVHSTQKIIPITITSVKWKLGQCGMI